MPFSLIRSSAALAALLTLPPAVLDAQELALLQATIVDPGALNFSDAAATFSQNINGRTYQRHPVSTLAGWQYATYFDGNRNVCLARRQLPAGSWEVIRFTDYTIPGNDSHNVVALGICALDGTIHLAFDHHADPWNYRVSDQGAATNPEAVTWSTDLFGPVSGTLGSVSSSSNVTYPTFFNAPNGNLMLYYRDRGSGNGDGMLHEYDGTTHDWTSGMGKFISRSGSYNGALSTNSTTRNPYINGISYAGTRLHASWGWRESAGGSAFNHDLNYAYSDDDGRTWSNSAGTQIGTTGSSFIDIGSPGLVVAPIPQNIGLSNQYTHYAYPDGSCHVMLTHNEAGTSTKRYHHYWRNASGTWSGEVLPFSGSRPKLVGDDDRSLFFAYATGGKLRIAKGVPNATRTAWTWTMIHEQSDTTEGGEGHIDQTRWEAERILSVYGQEKSNSAGSPTALHVFDYQVSAKAILPVPLNDQAGVPAAASLEWTAGIDAATHRIYLGTDPVAVANATTASPEYLGEQTATQFTPAAPLSDSTTHYWRVDEVDAASNVAPGLVWSFTTEGNFPPTITAIADQILEQGQTSPDIPFTIGDDLTAPAALVLSATSSNPTLLPVSGITFGGADANRLLQLTPAPAETGSSLVTITVDDGTHTSEESFLLTVTGPTYQLFSLPQDASVRENPDVVDIDKITTLLGRGGSSPRVDRATVYVFQLPDFGAVADPFTSASFTFEYLAKQGTLSDNDLYGLGRRSTPDVLATDYYGKTATEDPNADRLETGILTDATSPGMISTSSAGETALRDHLNNQYAAGAGANEFVFLRLNTAGYEDGIDRATLTMSEGAVTTPVDTRPRIAITTTVFSALQDWRAQHFGTPLNIGDGADDADPNHDGEDNFLEFVTGQNPNANSLVSTPTTINGANLEFSYPRSVAAVADGVVFIVEWSDTLLPGSWSEAGVSQSIDSDDGTLQQVTASMPTDNVPVRFARLRATSP